MITLGVGIGIGTEQQPKYGIELLGNSELSTDTIWTKANGVTIANNVATSGAQAGAVNLLSQAFSVTVGWSYKVTVKINSQTGAGVSWWFGQGTDEKGIGSPLTTAGTYTATYTPTQASNTFALRTRGAGLSTCVVDSLSIKKILR